MSAVVIAGDVSGTVTLDAPAVAGTTVLTLPATSGRVLTQNPSAPADSFVVNASGNVGIGTSSPAYKLHVVGGQARVDVSSAGTSLVCLGTGSNFQVDHATSGFATLLNSGGGLAFSANGAERMRIDSSGNVLVGKTSVADNVPGIAITPTNGTFAGTLRFVKTVSGGINALLNYHNGTYVGGINFDNTSTAFPTSSDVRLKKDIVEAGSASEKIDAIRIVAHGWKHDDAVVDFGIIAQELYEVMPRAVVKGDDGEEVETTWGVDYSKLVPMLIKAHQEQQAIITDLKARIEVLEGAA